MSYVVLARKWRPLTFDAMVGQEHISRTLQNAVRSGRVAHAFLFTGSRGVGKTSAARILAKCLNCDSGPTQEPCNQCPSCKDITGGNSLDVYEIDGASNTSVDDVRELRENIKYMPRPGKRKIYIIDEVHMLSKSAFNALLKTLEEPPEHVVFIFATTEPHKIPETIQSRCQRYDFKRIPQRKIQDRTREIALKEGLTISDLSISWIAKAADGSMRDAQSLLDQMISYCGNEITDGAVAEVLGIAGRELFMRISEAILDQDPAGCIKAIDDLYQYGYDLTQFYKDLVEHFRDLLMARIIAKPSEVLDLPDSHIEGLKRQVRNRSVEDLQRLVSILVEAEGDILKSSLPKVGLEVTLIKMARVSKLEPMERVLKRLEAMERRIPHPAGPGPATQPPPPPKGGKIDGDAGDRGPQEEAPPAGPLSSDPPVGQWAKFLEAVKKENAALGAQIENVVSWDLSPDALRVYYPEGSFIYEKIRQPDVQNFLSGHVRHYFGKNRVFLACAASAEDEPIVTSGTGKTAHSGNRPRSENRGEVGGPDQEEGKSNPAVQTALEIFGGTITEVKQLDPNDKP